MAEEFCNVLAKCCEACGKCLEANGSTPTFNTNNRKINYQAYTVAQETPERIDMERHMERPMDPQVKF